MHTPNVAAHGMSSLQHRHVWPKGQSSAHHYDTVHLMLG